MTFSVLILKTNLFSGSTLSESQDSTFDDCYYYFKSVGSMNKIYDFSCDYFI